MSEYPTRLTPTTSDFADCGHLHHTLQSVERSPIRLLVTTDTGGTFGWYRDQQFDSLYESGSGGTSGVFDYFVGAGEDLIPPPAVIETMIAWP